MSEDPKKPFHNPFEALRARRDELPRGPPPLPADRKREGCPARAVVRMERKGRGGKQVTVIDRLDLPAKELELWLKALKNALGCGGAIEGSTLVLQGDQRDRLPEVLAARGVRKVIVG